MCVCVCVVSGDGAQRSDASPPRILTPSCSWARRVFDRLEELMGRGLHLSDIPIHDATRDVILVGVSIQHHYIFNEFALNRKEFG